MLKPIRINETEKSRNFNEKLKTGIEHAINFILATDEATKIQISHFDIFLMPIETYLSAYKKKSILLKILADQAFTGEMYWFFELKTAITMGSMMRMMPPAAIDERIKTEAFDATDQDSFGEVGNQLCGILDRAFRNLTNKNIHLWLDFKKKVYPDETIQIATFLNNEEYVVMLATITIPKFGAQKLTLLLPRSLYERLLNLELQLEGITPRHVLVYSFDPERISTLQMKITSREVKVNSVEAADEILKAIEKEAYSAIGIEIKRPTFPFAHADTIFFKRMAANHRFTKLPYYLTWPQIKKEEIETITKLGLRAQMGDILNDFPTWSKSFTEKKEETEPASTAKAAKPSKT